MIKFCRKFSLPVLLILITALSLGGCRSMLPGFADGIGKAKLPTTLSRTSKSDVLKSNERRRPPPLLLSNPTSKLAEQAPPLLTRVEPSAATPLVSPKATNIELPDMVMPLTANAPPSGYFIPNEMLGIPPRISASVQKEATDTPVLEKTQPPATANTLAKISTPAIDVIPATKLVAGVYISPTTRAYFAAAGLDYFQTIVQPWEAFLQQSDMEVIRVTSSDSLLSSQLDVLILPSAVALNARERKSLAAFRDQGGSVMATWLAGVRNEFGQWVGFDFMQQVLDTGVTGTTAEDENDTFIFPSADSPVTHQLPAGLRIWLARAADWYPLRLSGKNTSLHVMDWSRTFRAGKSSSVMIYDERKGARPSRVATLGLPERLWDSIAVEDFRKILGDTLLWLAHRTDAYVATWPNASRSGVMLAMDAPNPLAEEDLSLFSVAETFGGKANFFALSEHLETAPESMLTKLNETQHEIAWLGDRYEEFKEQSEKKQNRRIANMLKEAASAGLTVSPGGGFHAPMGSYDDKTILSLSQKGFSYLVTETGDMNTLLPIVAEGSESLFLYPKSLPTISGLLNSGTTDESTKQFVDAIRTHLKFGGLTVVSFEQGEGAKFAQWKQILHAAFAGEQTPWIAGGKEVAAWTKELNRVSASVDLAVSPPLLTVTIVGQEAIQQPVSILVNLPAQAEKLRLVQDNMDEKPFSPNLSPHDSWRQRISLQGGLPGTYRWYLMLDSVTKPVAQSLR